MNLALASRRFELVRCLGEGGMGVVYEAIDRERSGARVALKTLRHLTGAALAYLKREFRGMQDVHHPNLATLGELVSEGDQWFFTMELVDGCDFVQYVRAPPATKHDELRSSRRPPPSSEARLGAVDSAVTLAPTDLRTEVPVRVHLFDEARLRDALRQLAEGISALHRAGLVHRDVKPSNVRVTPQGRVVLLDFGLVADTGANTAWTHQCVGTPAYMAPEQIGTARVGPEADWYALGVLLFEALTGALPFEGAALEIVLRKQKENAPLPSSMGPGVPPDLDALCGSLLRFDPGARPRGSDLLRMLGGSQGPGLVLGSASQTHTPPFVGRDEELGSLLAAFRDSREGAAQTVSVEGESGVGKSALVRQFVQRIGRETPDAVVLAGRCYERESVPYKAFDGVVDALARLLGRMPKPEARELVPTKPAPLLKVFPVLRRVEAIADLARGDQPQLDPLELRSRAFRSLRELFSRLGERRPIVVAIDDAQWADPDSLALLSEMMRPPDPPSLLLVLTLRKNAAFASEGGGDAQPVTRTAGAPSRRLELRALPETQAEELAAKLLERAGITDPAFVQWCARQAGGHPFFIDMIMRQAERLSREERHDLTLDEVVGRVIEELEPAARAALELVAVATGPVAQDIVARAAVIPAADFARIVSLLRVSHLVQTRGARGTDRIEPYHDRVRVAVLAQLDAARLVECHRRLAIVLESSERPDPEALVAHWRGAGDLEQAAHHAAVAGDRAAEGLAFDRAAGFYEVALASPSCDGAQRLAMLVKLGEARANAGRCKQAAQAFAEAARGASQLQALDLRTRAAEHLLSSGALEEGTHALREVLRAVGLRIPRSIYATIFWLVVYRIWAAILVLRFKPRATPHVRPESRARVDALFAVAIGYCTVDIVLATYMAARCLVISLRAGDRSRILRAASLSITQLAQKGGARGSTERRLAELAEKIAATEKDPEGEAFLRASQGICHYLRGEFAKARSLCDQAYSTPMGQRPGFQSNGNIFGLWATVLSGDFIEWRRRRDKLMAQAEDRGDLYTAIQIRGGDHGLLAADDPERARRENAIAASGWPTPRFSIQSWHRMYVGTAVESYVGNASAAYERCRRDFPAVKGALYRCQLLRILTEGTIGRTALACAAAEPSLRGKRVREVARAARNLERERMPWATAYATALRAGIAWLEGNRQRAIETLAAAEELFTRVDVAHVALSARYQRGLLLGGPSGEALMRNAEAQMTERGIRHPRRYAASWLPGLGGERA